MLLALELYFQACGCRFNAIQKMTVDEILNAAKVPVPCRHCKEQTANYRKHRRRCRKWQKAKRRGLVGDDEEIPTYSRHIRVRRHKTSRGSALPVVVDSRLYNLLSLWIRHMNLEEDPDALPFQGIRWEHLLTVLTRIVGKKRIDKCGPMGSKAMRQYAATEIMRKSSTPMAAMRRIGGSDTMAAKHYQDQRINVEEKLKEKAMLLQSSTTSSSTDSGEIQQGDSSDSDGSSEERKRPRVKGKLAPGQRGKSSNPVQRQSKGKQVCIYSHFLQT